MDVVQTTVGQNKGTARVWLQGNSLLRNGFEPGVKYTREAKNGIIVLTVASDEFKLVQLNADDGSKIREVSSRKKGDKQIPIIDINNDEIAKMFEGMSHVRAIFQHNRIVILPTASEIRARARRDRAIATIAAGKPLKMAAFAAGGGVLDHAMEKGLSDVGVASKLCISNEYREELTDHAMEHNSAWSKDTISLCGPMQEYAFDDAILRMVAKELGDDGEVDNITAGIPCSGASVAGAAKRKLVHAEAHPEVGHLIAPFIALIARFNPSTVVLENVPQYANTASMDILRSTLRDLHYDVHESMVEGADWNALENRKRMVMVAVTKGMSFDFAKLQRPEKVVRTLGEVLEVLPDDDSRWSQMAGLKAKEIRDAEAGKSFAMQTFNANSTKIATLTKGIPKNRSTDPKIEHPTNPDLLRVPTATEHARCKGIPVELIEGLCHTTAHELLGQSIIYDPFVSIANLIGQSYKDLQKTGSAEAALNAELVTEAVIARAKQIARAKMH